MKKYFYFLFFSLLPFGCKDTNGKKPIEITTNDSSSIYLNKAQNKNTKIADKLKYYKKSFTILKNQENDSITRSKLFELTKELYKNNFEREFLSSVNLLTKLATKSKDSFYLAQAYRSKGSFYKHQATKDSAFIYYTEAEKILKKIKHKEGLSLVLINKSLIQFDTGDYTGADRTLNNAYLISKKNNEIDNLYAISVMMGLTSLETKDFDKAIQYFNYGLEIVSKNNNIIGEFNKETCLNNIGLSYQRKAEQKKSVEDYKKSIEYFKSALKNKSIRTEDPELYNLLTDNLGYSYLKTENLDQALALFLESLKIREELNYPNQIVLSKVHLSEYYRQVNDTAKSKKYIFEALSLAKKEKAYRDYLNALKQASIIDVQNASTYSKEYIRLSDSIRNVEILSQEKFARIQLETDEIIKEKDILEDKNRSLLYTFIGVVFLLSMLFVVRAQRARTKELMFKQAQQRANEEIYNLLMAQQDVIDQSREIEKKKIARDLHDGILSRMFGARLNLDSINHLDDPESVKKRLEYLNELKEIEQDIREISHDLSREKQDLINNFVSITTNLFEEQTATHSAKLTYFMDSSIKWDLVKNNIKINVFRILQEGLQNINKYAKAKTISVNFRKENNELHISIEDDGIGFDVSKKSKGIGMQNMISRAIDCNGKLDINSSKENGTKITLNIPLE
ncbi:tetratricopeptide repeat-containing sensor histidine kinase [Flavobacterium solisilvae]|uniref:Tetratricopeptide repeat protein n=1 Tax=Flavobacterium solisilvae TaxID=1852019 RepID=A0ABX1QUG8_9FLAO|nr:tetratricopeptide repeat-containing sensor histidine kinase [Flavobacterium solisilvae]NMH25922.1 tetratricopeptide repeat protein [Flavobacterium solisilvae]